MNILPLLNSRWTLQNCNKASYNFTFTSAGKASCIVTSDDLDSLPNQLTITAVLSEDLSGYVPQVSCQLDVTKDSKCYTYYCVLTNNRTGFYSTQLDLPTGEFDYFTITLTSSVATVVRQLSLEVVSASLDEIMEQLSSEMPQLIEDYNTQDITISQKEQTIGLITANVLQATDMEGHFLLRARCSAASELTIRIYDDEAKCLYTPLIYNLSAGRSTIGVPHAYLKTLSGFHNFIVTAQATNDVTVDTRGMLYTINASHLAHRLLDSNNTIQDFTVATGAFGKPSVLYAMTVLDGVGTVKHIVPNDIGVSPWDLDFAISDVTCAAIEFDGSWESLSGGRVLITDASPRVFWADNAKTLYTQVFQDQTTRTSIATDVVYVAACRGWKYKESSIDNDVGLCVAYIKSDGKAYCRQLQIVGSNTVASWSAEELIPFTTTSTLKTVWVNRLNDFRMSFTAEDAAGNGYALITARYYQADSFGRVNITGDAQIAYLAVGSVVTPHIIELSNTSNVNMSFTLDRPVQLATSYPNALIYGMSLTDANNKSYSLSKAELRADGKHVDITLATAAGLAGVASPVKFTYTSYATPEAVGQLYYTSDAGLRCALETQTITGTLEDFSLKGYHDPINLQATPVITFAVRGLATVYGYGAENIQATPYASFVSYVITRKEGSTAENIVASDAVITFVVTKVGTAPI